MKLLSVLLSLLLMTLLLPGADWPQFRGPLGTGASSAKNLPLTWSQTENLRWKVALPGPGTSTPIIWKDRIYLTAYTGYNVPNEPAGSQDQLKRLLIALDRATGKTLWSVGVAAKLPEQESIRDSHGYASNTLTIDTDRIYCFFGKSGVQAFDHSGKALWQADVGDGLNGWGSAASLLLVDDLVIVNASVESESLIALDRSNGKERWRARGIRESWSTPVLGRSESGSAELLVPMVGKILAFEPRTGQQLWSCNTDITWYMVPTIVVEDNVAYSLGGRSGVVGLAVKLGGRGDVTKTHRLWTTKKGTNVPSPVFSQRHLFWMNDNQETAYCAEAATGKIVYEQRVPRAGQIYASALLADGKIFYQSRHGRTVVLAAKPEYELLASNDLNDGSLFHAAPVAVDGQLFIRSDRFLYCLEQK